MHRAAHILGNEAGEGATMVQRRFDGLVAAMARHRVSAGDLAGAIDHFRKVTRSHRPGLFHCYAIPELPRTDHGLEQLFGSQRYHERRATGRKMASPATVLRGEVRVIAATATRLLRTMADNFVSSVEALQIDESRRLQRLDFARQHGWL